MRWETDSRQRGEREKGGREEGGDRGRETVGERGERGRERGERERREKETERKEEREGEYIDFKDSTLHPLVLTSRRGSLNRRKQIENLPSIKPATENVCSFSSINSTAM